MIEISIDLVMIRGYPERLTVCPSCDRFWREIHHTGLSLPNASGGPVSAASVRQIQDINQTPQPTATPTTSDYGAALSGTAVIRRPNGKEIKANTGNTTTFRAANATANADDGPECKCGTPAKLLTTNKEGANKGRQFYTCTKPQ